LHEPDFSGLFRQEKKTQYHLVIAFLTIIATISWVFTGAWKVFGNTQSRSDGKQRKHIFLNLLCDHFPMLTQSGFYSHRFNNAHTQYHRGIIPALVPVGHQVFPRDFAKKMAYQTSFLWASAYGWNEEWQSHRLDSALLVWVFRGQGVTTILLLTSWAASPKRRKGSLYFRSTNRLMQWEWLRSNEKDKLFFFSTYRHKSGSCRIHSCLRSANARPSWQNSSRDASEHVLDG